MGREIERKFLVAAQTTWPDVEGRGCRQGYLVARRDFVVRVRLLAGRGFLTVKSRVTDATRMEYEYEVPAQDAREMLETLCEGRVIDKTRYRIPHGVRHWDVDMYHGENEGLCIAEIELAREDEPVDMPSWVGREVTDDPRYLDVSLALEPWRKWGDG